MAVSGEDSGIVQRHCEECIVAPHNSTKCTLAPDRRNQMPTEPALIDIDRMARSRPDAPWLDQPTQSEPRDYPRAATPVRSGDAQILAQAGIFQGVEPSAVWAVTTQLHPVSFPARHTVFAEG
ncbi:MAG: transcriptional regulator, crpfnr-family, partial [Mycobacterium sp.]|nr:transcriptional regulator, crpfnr-family [Mycobacterium sp.]